jgi:four helix bundle protein
MSTKRKLGFPHHSLDAYGVALDLAKQARQLATRVPRAHATLADHLLRSAGHSVLLLAEGAGRMHDGEKRQRYVEARGECGEAAAACELLLTYGVIDPFAADEYLRLADRLGRMLTGLVNRYTDGAPRSARRASEPASSSEPPTDGQPAEADPPPR